MALQSGSRELEFKFGANTKEVEKSLSQMKAKILDLTEALKKKQRLDGLETIELQAKAGIIPLSKLRDEITKTTRAAIAAKGSKAEFVNDKEILNNIIRLKELNAQLKKSGDEAQTLAQKMMGVGENLQAATLPLTAFTAALVAGGVASYNSFKEFERTLNTIKAVSDATDSEIQRIKESSLELGAQTIFSNLQVAKSYEELAKAGFTTSESLSAMPSLLSLAAAAGGDLALSSGIVASTLKAFNLEATDTGRLADVIAQGANQSAAGIEDLGLAYKQVAPIASQTNQSIEDMTALLAILANNAVKGGDAGSDLRNVITRLLDPSKEAAGVMAKLNVSLKDVNGNVKALPTFFKELNASFAGLSDAQKAQAASILAGAENLKTFLILTGQSPSEIDRFTTAMQLAAGSVDEMANTINSGSAKIQDEFGGAIETAATKIGESLSPAINGATVLITDLINAFSSNQAVLSFATGVAAASTAVIALGAAAGGTAALINVLKASLVGIPLGPISIGVAGVVTAFGLLTAAMSQQNEITKTATQTLGDLEATIQGVTNKSLQETNAAQRQAEAYDRLSTKTNLTKQEKELLSDALGKLKTQFPALNKPIEDLIKKYGSLANAVRTVRFEQAALTRTKAIDEQIKQVTTAAGKLRFLTKTPITGVVERSAAERKQLTNLQTQEKALLKSRENVSKDLIKLFKAEEEAAKKTERATVSGGGTSVSGGTAKTKGKTKGTIADLQTAQRQFADAAKKIEAERTGFELGEFRKREVEAEKAYQSQIAQLANLAKKGKISQSEVVKAQAEALKNYNATLAQIKDEELKYLSERQAFIQSIQNDTQRLNAELTQGNPFDDITADALAAASAIELSLGKAIDDLKEKFKKDKNSENYQKEEEALRRRAALELQLVKQTEEDKRTLATEAQNQLSRELLALRVELSGDELAIEKAKNANILADLDFQIAQTKARLDKARKNLAPNPTQDEQLGLLNLETDFQSKQAQREKLVQEGAQREAVIVVAAQARKVEAIQREIDLYGERQDLLDKQKQALEELVRLLQEEADLTGQTNTKRDSIGQQISESTKSLVDINTKTGKFGQTLTALQKIKLPNQAFDSFFQTAVQGLGDVNKAWETFSTNPKTKGGSFGDFLKTGEGLSSVLGAAGQSAQALTQAFTKGKGAGAKIGGALAGALGGAATGAYLGSLFGPAGTAVGAVAGAIIGGASALFGGGGSDKKQKQKQEKFDRFDAAINNILSLADSNDLNSLNAAGRAISAQFKKYGGSRNAEASKQAFAQLQAAIRQRQQVIDESIRELTFQNEILAKQLQGFSADDIQGLKIQREIDLATLTQETTKALEQFKDSAEVMNLITANAELRRQGILAGATESIINAAIQEQNKIRSIRAQTAVDNANIAGDAVGIINAELQARLVALDNDISAFQGAEETKTEFLKQKAAERNRIIKDANNQVDSLLQEGLAILNEGLVTAETKGEGQQKRIQKLFGNLNPGGFIQADGNLVSQSVNIGSGAFQFILEGINDAASLIDQLKDPAIQSALRTALNQAIARA